MSWLLRHSGRGDRSGYCRVADCAAFLGISDPVLEVRDDDKGRFELSQDRQKDRARQGRSKFVPGYGSGKHCGYRASRQASLQRPSAPKPRTQRSPMMGNGSFEGFALLQPDFDFLREISAQEAPEELWHGTVEFHVGSILWHGLLHGHCSHIHLTTYGAFARLGRKRAECCACVAARRAVIAGHRLWLSANGAYLVLWVPPDFIIIDFG